MKKKVLPLFTLFLSSLRLSSCFFLRHPGVFNSSLDNSSRDYPSGSDLAYKTPTYGSGYSSANRTKENVGIGRGYRYLPSVGNSKILVVPIETSDYKFTDNQIDNLQKAFFGTSEENGWESVASFYEKSSYGKLHLSGEISPVISLNATAEELSQESKNYAKGNQQWTDYLAQKVLSTLDEKTDLDFSSYDTNSDGYIDAVWLVYSVPYDQSSDLFWAFTTWLSSSSSSFDGKKACLYAWASYGFTNQNYKVSDYRNTYIDSHTYIHETGHRRGLDDYYSYDYGEKRDDGSTIYDTPIGGLDRMDRNILDHNVFSKYLLGWNKPTVVTKSYLEANNYQLTLGAYEKNGDALLIPVYKDGSRDYNGTPFDEYLRLEYYTPTNLNQLDASTAYYTAPQGYSTSGVLCYHVDARIGKLIPDSKGQPVWNQEVYDKLPSPDSNWGKQYLYTYLYSNTASYCFDQSRDDEGRSYYRGRLISLMPATGNRINGKASKVGNRVHYHYADNTALYTSKNKSFKDNYSSFLFDDGSKPMFSFRVTSMAENSCILSFTEF